MPPIQEAPCGTVRRVGVEIEFGGLDVARSAELVRSLFGGSIDRKSRFEASVIGTELGDFQVLLDAEFLSDQRYLDWLGSLGVELRRDQTERVEEILETVSAPFVPCEIVTPPIPLPRLDALDRLESALVEHRAIGTSESWRHAFGLHYNPELPGHDAHSILRHLRAFFSRYHALVEEMDVDVSRRITPFIDPFPETYVRQVFEADYAPDLNALIRDYVEFNPTRNRPLDMLPAFLFLGRDVLRSVLKDPRIHARPTFHYRLPNSDIGRKGWSLSSEWNRWVEIEEIAAGTKRAAGVG